MWLNIYQRLIALWVLLLQQDLQNQRAASDVKCGWSGIHTFSMWMSSANSLVHLWTWDQISLYLKIHADASNDAPNCIQNPPMLSSPQEGSLLSRLLPSICWMPKLTSNGPKFAVMKLNIQMDDFLFSITIVPLHIINSEAGYLKQRICSEGDLCIVLHTKVANLPVRKGDSDARHCAMFLKASCCHYSDHRRYTALQPHYILGFKSK